MSSSLKRTITYVEDVESQEDYRNRIGDDFDFESLLDLDRRAKTWYPGSREGSLRLDEGFKESAHDGLVEWHANNILLPMSALTPQVNDIKPGPQVNQGEVCYGMIHNARLKMLDVEFVSRETFNVVVSATGIFSIDLFFEDQCFFLKSSAAENFAVLNEETSKTLQEILSLRKCRYKSYIEEDEIDSVTNIDIKTEKNVFLSVNIVIYGPSEFREVIGKVLSSARTYLQHPCYQQAGTLYDNPHFLKLAALVAPLQSLQTPVSDISGSQEQQPQADCEGGVVLAEKGSANAQIRRKVATVFNSLTRSKNLKRLEADIRINTQLLPHQEEALDFMAQREFGPIPSEYSLWSNENHDGRKFYQHKLVGSKTSQPPVENGGGILADDMGLGKTLTVISTIIRTTDQARLFAKKDRTISEGQKSQPPLVSSRSTLVVCPSPLLLDGWIKEIEDHCDGSLSIVVYHGRGRETNPVTLADSDIVMSTYHTIAAEVLDPESPLYKINWFRIVLDEAHIIRRISTKLFRAISKVSANLRWCLTGTPVQNSLEDLASLVAFIGVNPLDNLPEFRKHVIFPLMKNVGLGTDALRFLLDSICLRRTKKLLDLPEDRYEDREVEFSAVERNLYSATEVEMIKAVKQHDNQPRNAKGYFGIFQLQLQLRRLCNHGTFQKPFTAAPGENVQFDPDEALALLQLKKDAKCTYCNAEVTGLNGIEEVRSGHFTVCGHLLCSDCVPRFKKALRRDDTGSSFQCSLCLQKVPAGYLVTEKMIAKQSVKKNMPSGDYFMANGHSSKISALVADVERNDTGIKGIIFSCWTRSLDLVGKLLSARGIRFARIDGSCSLAQRQKMLEAFNNDDSVPILVMTTGTGATGLNLTVASVVYILEPQWNPMVEDQAIARVLRLGQKKEVQVIRYVVKTTVEEGMRDQQKTKLELAKVGWRQDD